MHMLGARIYALMSLPKAPPDRRSANRREPRSRRKVLPVPAYLIAAYFTHLHPPSLTTVKKQRFFFASTSPIESLEDNVYMAQRRTSRSAKGAS